jgi:hypothetical protein
MFARLVFGVGLLALGYYVGREIGRNESLREELDLAKGRPAEPPERAGQGPGQTKPRGPADRS